MRVRPAGIAASQSGAGIGDAVPQPVRHGLRQRRLPPGHGAGRRARRLGRVSDAAGGGPRARQIPRHRRQQLRRHRDRNAARARRNHRIAGRRRGSRRGDRVERPGSRDQLCPADRRVARRTDRHGAARDRRHRSRVGRRRLAFRPRIAPRQHCHAERLARHHRQGTADRQPRTGSRARRSRIR